MVLLWKVESAVLLLFAVTIVPLLLTVEWSCLMEWRLKHQLQQRQSLIHAQLDQLSPQEPQYWQTLQLLADDQGVSEGDQSIAVAFGSLPLLQCDAAKI